MTFCFVCNRCEYPICGRDDLLTFTIPDGTTQSAFEYKLEDLLDVEDPVPCYSGEEATEVTVSVSDRILDVPLPPAARLLALEAVVESQRRRRNELNEQRESLLQTERDEAGRNLMDAVADDGVENTDSAQSQSRANVEDHNSAVRGEGNNGVAGATSPSNSQGEAASMGMAARLARYGRLAETRVDLVCVRPSVNGVGLVESTRDRGTHVQPVSVTVRSDSAQGSNPPVSNNNDNGRASSGDVAVGNSHINDSHSSSHNPTHRSPTNVTASILHVAHQPPRATEWTPHPGNFTVEESFIHVRRRTRSAQAPWFAGYGCKQRLECPDCHLGLGYLFVRKCATEAIQESSSSSLLKGDDKAVCTNEDAKHPGHGSHLKRERCEATLEEVNPFYSQTQDGPLGVCADSFVGLELKKIRQREWGLVDFQKRYHQAQYIKSFRDMFPEAEELESLYSRLTALRTQSELYNNLLRKHKEQNDVQSALLHSQKERINTYEEKLRTMQQIIEAQRAQLDMQCRQMKHQEQLVRNHKSQVLAQQQQIHVEQLLLSEQCRTITTQREQLSLIQAHLRARLVQERLEERCEQLTSILETSRQQQDPEELTLSTMVSPVLPSVGLTSTNGTAIPTVSSQREQPQQRQQQEEDEENSTSPTPGGVSLGNLLRMVDNVPTSREAPGNDGSHHPTASPSVDAPHASAMSSVANAREGTERAMAIIRRIAEERARRRHASETASGNSAKTQKTEGGVPFGGSSEGATTGERGNHARSGSSGVGSGASSHMNAE